MLSTGCISNYHEILWKNSILSSAQWALNKISEKYCCFVVWRESTNLFFKKRCPKWVNRTSCYIKSSSKVDCRALHFSAWQQLAVKNKEKIRFGVAYKVKFRLRLWLFGLLLLATYINIHRNYRQMHFWSP